LLQDNGPLIILPGKTRIAFQVRMSFAQLTLRRSWVLGHFVLARRAEARSSPGCKAFHAQSPPCLSARCAEQVAAYTAFAREAYAIGRQGYLG
jgi:hypothetical protein